MGCECRFKGSRATPIITYLCNYHRRLLKNKIKKMIIKWSLKQISKEKYLAELDFGELEEYGIEDILDNEHTGEPMYVLKKYRVK